GLGFSTVDASILSEVAGYYLPIIPLFSSGVVFKHLLLNSSDEIKKTYLSEIITGEKIVNMLKTALTNIENTDYSTLELRLKVADAMKDLGLSPDFVDRYLNEGFSGGERKRNEILQLAVLNPKLAILDETDSGLDVDGLRIVGEGISKLRTPERGYLIVTHYQRLLEYITPDFVHVFVDGKIVETGGKELSDKLEKEGYESYQ
ncbi:ATP-binding cassette domain-containing protein, partial [Acidimicrobiia bacterium]|nr:ATP-binding cassette domain-containing protein [Acidimicrobiia bacterium]